MKLALSFLDVDDQPMTVVQPDVQTPQLEVIVTDVQHTMTFNGEQVHICEQVPVDVVKSE